MAIVPNAKEGCMQLTLLKLIVAALERRSPNHNGPFEYGTRLAEETGELIEALYEMKKGSNKSRESQVVREIFDTLRVTLGIAKAFGIEEKISDVALLRPKKQRPANLFGYVAQVGVACSGLANAINYAKGVGVKREKKYSSPPMSNLQQRVQSMVLLMAELVDFLGVNAEFDRQVTEAFQRYADRGYTNGV